MKYSVLNRHLILDIDAVFAGRTIRDVFQAFHLSRKTIHLLKQYKQYTVNGQYVDETTMLSSGDQLSILAFSEDDDTYPPSEGLLDIVYEDEILLVVNKPPHLPVYPASLDDHRSLAHQVSGYYHARGLNLPVRFIHRLDDGTSGLVMFVKCTLLQPMMDDALARKEINRSYIAFVAGRIPDNDIHVITSCIARDRHNAKRMRVAKQGQKAVTRYRRITQYEGCAAVSCTLETGRRHQIRVHMASIGHPILGDPLYNPRQSTLTHQALHAVSLSFTHPLTGKQMTLKAKLPDDLKAFKKKLRPDEKS